MNLILRENRYIDYTIRFKSKYSKKKNYSGWIKLIIWVAGDKG